MGVYFMRKRGWRYDFNLKGIRYTKAGFKTKKAARKAEEKRKEELQHHDTKSETPTDMDFLTLVNSRLDHVKRNNSQEHFRHVLYHVRRWIKEWGSLKSCEITPAMVEKFVYQRAKVSHFTGNKEIRYLRALFNFGIKKGLVSADPTAGIEFLPVEKRKKYIPPKEDVLKVINHADPDTHDYLWVMILTAARMSEVNALTWDTDWCNSEDFES